MLLCPLDYAFPTVDEKITKTYTNKSDSNPNRFDYVESNTNSFNENFNEPSETAVVSYKQDCCPYCKKNNYSKFYKSNSIDLITITALSFLFFSIIKGK